MMTLSFSFFICNGTAPSLPDGCHRCRRRRITGFSKIGLSRELVAKILAAGGDKRRHCHFFPSTHAHTRAHASFHHLSPQSGFSFFIQSVVHSLQANKDIKTWTAVRNKRGGGEFNVGIAAVIHCGVYKL